MLKAISEPRKELSPFAPRIETVQIDPEDIRIVIGKGGETIQKITGELGVEIDIEDSGIIFITSVNGESMQKAKEWIQGIVAKPEVGAIYDATVARVIPGVGAIAEFLRGKDGMIHISELAWGRTENVEDVVNVGDKVQVKCVEYDAIEGRTRLSLKQMSAPPEGYQPPPPRPMGGGFRGGRPSGGGGRGPRMRNGGWEERLRAKRADRIPVRAGEIERQSTGSCFLLFVFPASDRLCHLFCGIGCRDHDGYAGCYDGCSQRGQAPACRLPYVGPERVLRFGNARCVGWCHLVSIAFLHSLVYLCELPQCFSECPARAANDACDGKGSNGQL
jgi:predicted RNA-binding protein with RPS1 domain